MKDHLPPQEAARIALYGGSFDPLHHGHLVAACDALEQFRLDAVILIPCRQSPHKLRHRISEGTHRYRMIRQAIRGLPGLYVSACELRRPPPSYSVDTAREMAQLYPKALLFWLLGTDQLPELSLWKDYEELARLVRFLAVPRPGFVERLKPSITLLPKPRFVDISSSEIRSRVRKSLPYAHLVPWPVARYIERHGLYR
ncbi:nicotinate-nucleotide adenylyltransferase [Candidatus Methylacidithermus pantelleriae]|uniref:Probable nicotinate-nucleotide adenylyltransferase n=1 Tax=Candidatus Methylacidithermus pantelleriae TaxID=2744239 RepID=A0A8J2BN50_9BACT|nr:nicotinate-nucleotide adenylyltransferase [Candidatus Methylacidithermus pantelleriae]CAF0695009.1 putative nicotinate-nucleotide adenylyltransferase [Candidatus Methylacidithermus pantelleriae]